MKSLKRFFTICSTLIPAFLAYSLAHHNTNSKKFQESCIRIRLGFQTLGTTYIKLGQLLCARPDIIGLDLASELRNLLDHEPIIPFITIQHVIESESNTPLSKIYKKIEHTPLGTASIAQVHKGTLLNGTAVAIKVQRPGVVDLIYNDLPILKKVCHVLELLIPNTPVKFTYIYSEFEDWITNELDFRVEGRRADKFNENMAGVEGVVIPHIYWQHSSKLVLVMSFLEGYTLNDLLHLMKKQHVATLYELKLDYKIDPDLLIQRTVAAVAKQALVDKYFHGDLHPANIIIQKNSKVALIDFGIIGTFNAEEHAQLLFLLLALVHDDPQALVKVIRSLITTDLNPRQVAT